jgi:hypothetical protein
LWFTSFDGVSVVDPRHLPFNRLPPPVHIEQVTADGYGAQSRRAGKGCSWKAVTAIGRRRTFKGAGGNLARETGSVVFNDQFGMAGSNRMRQT